MSDAGKIGWHDLTVEAPGELTDFYEKVCGWKASGHPVDDYEDFVLTPAAGGEPVGGLCHARGGNTGIPAQWLMYVVVPDLVQALATVVAEGGQVLVDPRPAGGGTMGVVADPSGAIFALYQAAA